MSTAEVLPLPSVAVPAVTRLQGGDEVERGVREPAVGCLGPCPPHDLWQQGGGPWVHHSCLSPLFIPSLTCHAPALRPPPWPRSQ